MNHPATIQLPQNPADQAVRAAVIDNTRSFAVSAPAGSGKTGLLTQRFLNLLATCNNPEDVLAITFTRKAAAEMRKRITEALLAAATMPAPAEPYNLTTWQLAAAALDRNELMGWNLLESPQRLQIQTIDSLCSLIVSQAPLSSDIVAPQQTLEDAEHAYRLAVRKLMSELDLDSPLKQEITLLLRHMDNNLLAIEDLLVSLLAKREQWLDAIHSDKDLRITLESALSHIVHEHLEELRNQLALFLLPLMSVCCRAAANLHEEGVKNSIPLLGHLRDLPPATPDALPLWNGIADLLLTSSGTYRARLTKNEGFPAGKDGAQLKEDFASLVSELSAASPDMESLLAGVRVLPPVAYDDGQWQLLSALISILPALNMHLTSIFQEQSATDFTTISQSALKALRQEGENRLDYPLQHILIDEFQDTAGPQLELIRLLTRDWLPSDGRTLFIVGDGMQSCYGFRNANVGLFLDVRANGIGAIKPEPADLTVNFRSQAGLVHWNNLAFEKAFPKSSNISLGAVQYSASVPFKPQLPDNAVQTHICSYETESEVGDAYEASNARQAAQQQEASRVLSLVRTTLKDEPEATIGILVRTRSHLQHILPALKSAGIAYHATEIEQLANRMVIQDLTSLTKALIDPSDRIAWLSVLRAPWCGLDNHDLLTVATEILPGINPPLTEKGFPALRTQLQHFEKLTRLSPEGKKILARVVPLIERAQDFLHRKSLRDIVEGLWLHLGGPATLLEAGDYDNVAAFFSLLSKHESNGIISRWTLFSAAIAKLYASSASSPQARVHVMTIHKSKGLEFDTVIIPGLDRTTRADDKELLLWHERINKQGQSQILLSPLAPAGKDQDALYGYVRDQIKFQRSLEATRLLYVGCTRAIHRLHLLACLPSKDEKLSAPAKNSLLASLWPMVKNDAQLIEVVGGETLPPKEINTHFLRITPEWSPPSIEQSIDAHSNAPGSAPEVAAKRLTKHIGMIIHATFRSLIERGCVTHTHCPDADDIVLQYSKFWQSQVKGLGWTENNATYALERIRQAVKSALTTDAGRWVLNCAHESSATDLELICKLDDRLCTRVVDRLFVADGVRWIIDYNYSAQPQAENTAEFFTREMKSHKTKTDEHKAILNSIHPLPTKTAIYFTHLGILKTCN